MKKGIAASNGYAIGKVFLKIDDDIVITEKSVTDKDEEKLRLNAAVEVSRIQLTDIKNKTTEEIGESEAEVFGSHLMMLDDPEFVGCALQNIECDNISAEAAVKRVTDMYMAIFSEMEDEYMKERAADIKDVSDRILRNLTGKVSSGLSKLGENTVVVAHDLTPSDTAQLDKSKVIGFLTDIGGCTSHSAIMARTLEIPAVVGLGDITSNVKTGDTVIVDGVNGEVYINPDDETLRLYKEKKCKLNAEKEELKKLVDTKTITKTGKEIIIAGNIGSPEDICKVIENGGEGVGLFRTEFLYMDRTEMPSEDEQFRLISLLPKRWDVSL
jgi:phosphotransferase system enzyme I (PtsI)